MKCTKTIALKNMLLFIIVLIVAFFLGAVWYSLTFSMDEAKVFEVHSPNLDKKLLVTTQGSDFKDAVTAGIVENYERDSVYIKVIGNEPHFYIVQKVKP